MTNRAIRKLQSENSKKTLEDGTPLVRQWRFPKPTNPIVNNWEGNNSRARRKRQIAKGQLKKENGLA